jgi:hypothetical protein
MHRKISRFAVVALLASVSLAASAGAQTIDPFYADHYTFTDVGTAAGVPTSYGGINFLPTDPNTLLIVGRAGISTAEVYSVTVARDAQNHITGFTGNATLVCSAPNADGGVEFAQPGNVLMVTTWPGNDVLQFRPGSTAPDRSTDLGDVGVVSSTGSVRIVPAGFPGAGRIKFLSYTVSGWFDSAIIPDGDTGLFNFEFSAAAPVALSGFIEAAVYVDNTHPQFANDSVLVNEWSAGTIASYEIDGNGDPIATTRHVFMSGVSGVEGAAIDPLTGDFVISTYTSSRVLVVRRAGPPPSCPCDSNRDGFLNSQDFFDFLSAFFALEPSADFNGDTFVNSQDFFDWLGCFFSRPTGC